MNAPTLLERTVRDALGRLGASRGLTARAMKRSAALVRDGDDLFDPDRDPMWRARALRPDGSPRRVPANRRLDRSCSVCGGDHNRDQCTVGATCTCPTLGDFASFQRWIEVGCERCHPADMAAATGVSLPGDEDSRRAQDAILGVGGFLGAPALVMDLDDADLSAESAA